MTEIYTDGASRGNPGPGGWGVVVLSEREVRELGGGEPRTTNNKMELTAAIRALEACSDKKLTIYTDSEYVAKGMTEWIFNWQKKGWKTANKKPVLNQDLWQKLSSLAEDREISWKYVPAHSGIRLNERADEIATGFADAVSGAEKPKLFHGPKNAYR